MKKVMVKLENQFKKFEVLLNSWTNFWCCWQATDLHCHHIDHITIPSKRGPKFGVLKRVEDVSSSALYISIWFSLYWVIWWLTKRREGGREVIVISVEIHAMNVLIAGVWLLVWEWINAIWLHSLPFWESRAVWAEFSWSFCCRGSWSDPWVVKFSCVLFSHLESLVYSDEWA
jgi:hypothetical protein